MKEATLKYAVAIFSKDREKIMATFDTKAEADAFGRSNKVPSECGQVRKSVALLRQRQVIQRTLPNGRLA